MVTDLPCRRGATSLRADAAEIEWLLQAAAGRLRVGGGSLATLGRCATHFEKALKDKLKDHVRSRLSGHAYPREICFIDDLPMTITGKIQRGVLRQMDRRRGHDDAM